MHLEKKKFEILRNNTVNFSDEKCIIKLYVSIKKNFREIAINKSLNILKDENNFETSMKSYLENLNPLSIELFLKV